AEPKESSVERPPAPVPPPPPPPPPLRDAAPARPAASALGSAPAPEPENYDAFAHEPPFRPRRNPARMWTIIAIVAGALMLAATAALLTFDLPKLGRGIALLENRRTPLDIQDLRVEDGRLASGNALLTVTGRITNPTQSVQRVPQLRAEVLEADRKTVVYRWSISPPVSELQPGQSATFNSAEMDVPTAPGRRLNVVFRSAD
ncbi:MAG TPA: hypothetical protein VFR28_11745, partial [Allosphingosinicella sp.]|nr:hypothetical protein [Allosphingosinicella sp.]